MRPVRIGVVATLIVAVLAACAAPAAAVRSNPREGVPAGVSALPLGRPNLIAEIRHEAPASEAPALSVESPPAPRSEYGDDAASRLPALSILEKYSAFRESLLCP